MIQFILILHTLAATIWVGGHLILTLGILPGVMKRSAINELLEFEAKFEKIGLPALLALVITGFYLAYSYGIRLNNLFVDGDSTAIIVSIKLCLLLLTLILAIHARFFLIPKLTISSLWTLFIHIILVTIIGLLMLILGVSVRFGGM